MSLWPVTHWLACICTLERCTLDRPHTLSPEQVNYMLLNSPFCKWIDSFPQKWISLIISAGMVYYMDFRGDNKAFTCVSLSHTHTHARTHTDICVSFQFPSKADNGIYVNLLHCWERGLHVSNHRVKVGPWHHVQAVRCPSLSTVLGVSAIRLKAIQLPSTNSAMIQLQSLSKG